MKPTTRGRKPSTPSNRSTTAVESSPATSLSTGDARPSSSRAGDGEEATGDRKAVTSFVAVAAHLVWIFAGPAVLALLLISIVMRRTSDFSVLDVTYFVVAGAVLVCRWIDQRTGQATTGTGEFATWADFHRYAIRMPPLALGTWIVAKLIAGFLS